MECTQGDGHDVIMVLIVCDVLERDRIAEYWHLKGYNKVHEGSRGRNVYVHFPTKLS